VLPSRAISGGVVPGRQAGSCCLWSSHATARTVSSVVYLIVGIVIGFIAGNWVGGWRAIMAVSRIAHRDLMGRAGLRRR
jgi:hypothetical protein